MYSFQEKVDALKQCESYVYTLCLHFLIHEYKASESAKQVLIALFKDSVFWKLDNAKRRAYILSHCMRFCHDAYSSPLAKATNA
ncbi:hypothetical protein [Paenibacillus sp. HB172176]|uniref:hypothetical protein n=1 Tax=Paenibacillus sp. HB172176 TaxID=2493690 RepID=UPI001438E526|nr:hypothetical protein [Paenibacillus sp. HB172176]